MSDPASIIRFPKGERGDPETLRLKSGGGGGTFDGMEQRVAKIEGQFEKLNEKVDTLRIDVAVLKERVGNLPSKGFIVSATVTSLALLGAVSVFGERLLALLSG
jgi:hypothetical protein